LETWEQLMGDWLSFVGGVVLIVLGVVSWANPHLVWKLYSLDRKWREENPERTPQWDARTRRFGSIFVAAGGFFVILGASLPAA